MNSRVLAQTKPAAKNGAPPVRGNLMLQQRTRHCDPPAAVPPVVHDVLNSSGQPLDRATRAFMEPRFGHNFGHVRVHTNTNAADSAHAVHAQAYTVGNNVVFGANKFAPATHHGRELLAHELAHTIQQRSRGAPPPSQDPSGIFESSANSAGRDIANGANISGNLPACGIGVARAPVPPSAFDNQQLDDEIKRATESLKPGEEPGWWLTALQAEKQSRVWQAENTKKEHEQRAGAERERKERAAAAERERKERATAVAEVAAAEARWKNEPKNDKDEDEVQMTSMALESGRVVRQRIKKPRKPAPARWEVGDAIIKKVNDENKKANEELDARLAKEREIAKTPYKDRLQLVRIKLQPKSGYWYSRNEAFSRMTGDEVWSEGVKEGLFCESEKRAVYEDQNSLQQYINEEMQKDRDRARAKFESDKYQAWVAQGEQLSSPQMIIQPFLIAAAAPELVAAAYFGTQSGEMVGNMVNACRHGSKADCAAASAQVASAVALHVAAVKYGATPKSGGGEPGDPNLTVARGVDVTQGGPFVAPDVITPSRPVAGFARDIEPKPAPVVVTPGESTQMPPARVVQGNQPTVGNLKPAFETQGPPASPSPRVTGFKPPPKDIAEKPGLIEAETGPREYVKREYLGDRGAAGEQQSRYHVNVQLDEHGMMDSDFVLRGGGKRSGSLSGKDEFLAAKQHFEQQNGAGSVKGAYGRWGGGDNLDTFNTRYGISTGKGLPHDEAMIEAARKTKTGEWARAAGFNNVKITKAEGSPGAYTNVEVEFTK